MSVASPKTIEVGVLILNETERFRAPDKQSFLKQVKAY